MSATPKDPGGYGTEVGQMYNGEIFTNIVNIGHGLLSVKDGMNIGRLDYPGPGSGGNSYQKGDCTAITEQMPWIVGPGTPVDDGSHQPRMTKDAATQKVLTAGWAPPGETWLNESNGQIGGNMTKEFVWVDLGGVIGSAPAGNDNIVAAEKDLNRALLVAQSAARIIASAKVK